MSEFLFAFFIITGFLLGMVFFSNLLHYSIYLLPKYISLKLNKNLNSPLGAFLKITYPLFLWLITAIAATFVILYYFTPYSRMFISGIIISVVFILIDLMKKK